MRAGDHASRTTTAVAKGFKLTGTPAFTLPESRRQQKMVKRAGTSHGVTHSQPARNGNFPETAAHSQHTQRSTDITYAAQTGDKGGGTHLDFAAGASCVVPSITYIVPVPASVGRLNDAAALSLFTSRMRRVPDGDTKACARPQPCSHHGDGDDSCKWALLPVRTAGCRTCLFQRDYHLLQSYPAAGAAPSTCATRHMLMSP